VETKAPVRHHRRRADNLTILLSNLYWGWSGKEIKVENTPESVVLKVLSSFARVVDLQIYPIAVQEEYTMRFLTGYTVFEVYGMVSVKIGSRRNLVRITGPQRPNVVCRVESERIRIFSKSIKIRIVWKVRPKAQVLSLKDKRCC